MVMTVNLKNYSDKHYTKSDIAQYIIDYFQPTGKILEPFRGGGAFYDHLPKGTSWCEVDDGIDFYQHHEKVDWLITNPPFKDLTNVMKHCFTISTNTVLLVPLSKVYSSMPRMNLIRTMAGIKEEHVMGSGRNIGFNLGFPFGAIHFLKGYTGPITRTWYNQNSKIIDIGEC